MSSEEVAIRLEGGGKEYPRFSTRKELLWNLLFPFRFKTKRFTALEPLTLEIHKGECVGVMGVNGSGKSTLLQMIAGTLYPTSGKVFIEGRVASLLELGSWIDASDTGRQNIYTAGYSRGLKKHEIEAQIEGIIEFAEIGDFIDQPVSTYSTGMVMRLAFATCIYLQADILLLDEIFAVGDFHFAQKCIAFLREYIKDKTVLLVSHDCNIVSMLCSRAILLDHSRLVADGTPRDITERYMELCYGEKQDVKVSGKQEWNPGEPDFREGDPVEATGYLPDERSFGEGGAEILETVLSSDDGETMSQARGGEAVKFTVRIRATKQLEMPAIGFRVRSPEGINIWGDTSIPGAIPVLAEGGEMEVVFHFVLPRLENGTYSVGVAVSTGKLEDHHIQLWNHNAMTFRIKSSYPLLGAMVGLPMSAIECREVKNT
ncbi:MAG: ABC transporter ATP-binding protein [Lentisphaeria bacterium]|nr:ABC transporter ATP-binding protein [Lentisphaeria bacterium]